VHDSVSGERAGVPSVGIMTEQFVSAAELMVKVLGADGHEIAHPISSATADRLGDAARAAAVACVGLLTA
jgi:hypothetical protein